MCVIHRTYRKINIQGIDNHEVTGLDVVTAATLLNTSQGKVIGIFNEYTYLGKGSSIHSSGQLEWFKTNVDEKSVKVGGTQLIFTLDGYSVPLLIKDGLAYATSLGRPTAQDMDTYPHVFFTSPDEWDPSVLDHDPPHLDRLDPSQVPDQPFGDPMFDACGDFNKHIIASLNTLLDAPPGDCGSYTEIPSVFTANLHQSSPQEPDWHALRPFLAWTSPLSIKDTFNVTTRHGTAPHIQHYHSEPYHQHQNKAENNFGLTKLYTNTVRNTSGCPACCWLLCLQYICVVLNHLASPTLQEDQEYDWTRSVYSGACEQIPHDIPKPLGKHGQTTHYVDANLHHDLATGKAVTVALHFLNQIPIDAYSKRHHLVSYHRVREAIAAKYISFHWKDGKSNPADILSKHWEFASVWPMLKPILFWRGETATQLKGSDRIPSTIPGAEPPRDARDSGSARSHSTHLETSSSDRP